VKQALVKCSCPSSSAAPIIIVAGSSTFCDLFNITLESVQEHLDRRLVQVQHSESLVIYRQAKSDGTYQVGIFGAIDVADCAKGAILPHENVTAASDITILNGRKKVRQVLL
jgi:hypothetical protein